MICHYVAWDCEPMTSYDYWDGDMYWIVMVEHGPVVDAIEAGYCGA